MNRQRIEDRLQADAARIEAACPERVSQRVAARIRAEERRPSRWFFRPPALAGAAAVLALCALVWIARLPGGPKEASLDEFALNAVPVVASSDRLMASREAALANERQLLEQDLRHLRDQLTATFLQDSNG